MNFVWVCGLSRFIANTTIAHITARFREHSIPRRREYRDRLQKKREAFWKEKIDTERSTPGIAAFLRHVDGSWRRFNLCRHRADELLRFFKTKVAASEYPLVMLLHRRSQLPLVSSVLRVFRQLCVVDVFAATWLLFVLCLTIGVAFACQAVLKDDVDMLLPFFVELLNRSFSVVVVPSIVKSTYIAPCTVEKADLDPAMPSRTVRFRTYQVKYRRNCWNVSSRDNCSTACRRQSCCQDYGVPTELTIRRRRQSWKYWPTSCVQWTAVALPC